RRLHHRRDPQQLNGSTMSTSSAVLVRVAELQRDAGHLIAPIGVAAIPAKPAYFPRPEHEEWDWIVLDLEDDPVYQAGELAIPKAVRTHLAEIERAGAKFDRMLIAHEVPRGSDE